MDFKLTFYARDQEHANQAAKVVFERMAELNRIFSDYDPDSELSQLSATAGSEEPFPLSPELWDILERAQEFSVASEGAFDVTVGPLVRLWRRARREKQLPTAERLAQARQAVGYRLLELDPHQHAALLTAKGMRLDLGGIAAGWAADEALVLLGEQEIPQALVDVSGDIVAGDPPPGARGWRIGIAALDRQESAPSRYVLLSHRAISTSGDAWQFVEIDGKRYSHIVDPATGLGLTGRASVTILAPDCTTADALATAVCVLGPEKGLALVEATPEVSALILVAEESGVKSHESRRLAAEPKP